MADDSQPTPSLGSQQPPEADEELVTLLGTTLSDAELRFHAVVESLVEGLAIFDCAGVLRFCNSRFEQLTGYSREEMQGKRIYEIFFRPGSPELDEYFSQMLDRYRARRAGVAETYQSYIYTKSGERRRIETKASPLRDKTGRIIGSIGANTDITERTILEEQLRWSQRMEAVGRLAGGLAHDFNNLLTAIYGYSDLMVRSLSNDSSNHRRADLIRQSAESACKLTRQLLTLSRQSLIQKEEVALDGLARQTAEIVRGMLGEKIQLELSIEEPIDSVLADSAQLQQVLINLILNARDALEGSGKIKVGIRREILSERLSTPRGDLPPGTYAVMMVEDNGPGIDPRIMPHLFEPFFTTKRNSGTGLGLSTSYALVRQLGGEILVASRPEQGARFDVYLPAAAAAVPIPKAAPKHVLPVQGNETILVAEDDVVVRQLVVEVLQQHGYHVIQAADGAEALKLLAAGLYTPAVLLSDILMPNLDGMALATKVLEQDSGIKVILMSGCANEEGLLEEIEKLRLPFLPKPFSPPTLLQIVRMVLDTNDPTRTRDWTRAANSL